MVYVKLRVSRIRGRRHVRNSRPGSILHPGSDSMGSKSSPALSAVAVLSLALAAVIGLKSVRMSPELQWVGSISAEAKTQHVHPGMDDATLLSLTPSEG